MDNPTRKIIHVDMDAFFASVEQRDDPDLRGKPVAVGGGSDRGVVAAASYEARKFGVHSAMPGIVARRLCPKLIFVRPDFTKYRAASDAVFEIFHEATPLVEGISIDEAYLDVTENNWGESSATNVAKRIKERIVEVVGLTASAGVAGSKSVAKIASSYRKPDGLTIVPPNRTLEFLRPLSIKKISGVGPKTAERLNAMGLMTIGDVEMREESVLVEALGKHGRHVWLLANGIDPRPVQIHRERKSHSAERTFSEDVIDLTELLETLAQLTLRICDRLAGSGQQGRTLTVKVRTADFTTRSKAHTMPRATNDPEVVMGYVRTLLAETAAGEMPVRLVGVGLSKLEDITAESVNRPVQLIIPGMEKWNRR